MASAAEEMPDPTVVGECESNIPRRRKVVRMHALAPNNSVIRLESFGSEEDCRPKASNVGREVDKEVKFRLIEPTRGPADHVIEKLGNCSLETGLRIRISLWDAQDMQDLQYIRQYLRL
jgi:hypothetical protein